MCIIFGGRRARTVPPRVYSSRLQLLASLVTEVRRCWSLGPTAMGFRNNMAMESMNGIMKIDGSIYSSCLQ